MLKQNFLAEEINFDLAFRSNEFRLMMNLQVCASWQKSEVVGIFLPYLQNIGEPCT